MGSRKVRVRATAAQSIAEVAWFIESKGLYATAEKFSEAVYDKIDSLADERIIHPVCREPERNSIGLKCIPFRKKYTIVFYESAKEIIVHEFLSSKKIHW